MKEYVSVTARFDCDGNLLPVILHWKDGRDFSIDRILDMRYAASLKAGGAGIRYKCRIMGQEKYLFLEDNRWFVEGK
ncbi:MAG: hypothetical protein Q4D44_05760 [Eubacteriales bacterium]|nr:hypothetical protein [Eubacteriales bacterium]